MEIQSHRSSLPSCEAISHQLERMLSSPDFSASPQQTDFLEFVVNQTLAGNACEIKGYTVATEVFGRSLDFDQSIDPVVSIQAGRLRRALERYYLTAGQHDPIRIDIPKGTYVPAFSEQRLKHQPIVAEPAAIVGVIDTWPTVLVQPLSNLTVNPEDNYLSTGLTAELAHALGHYREIRIFEARHLDQKSHPSVTDFDFVIDGHIRRDPTGIWVTFRLYDAKQGIQIWSGKYQGDFEVAKMISFQENVAAEVAVRLAGDNAVISKHPAKLSRNKAVTELTTYEAILRYWEYNTLRTRQGYMNAVQALEHALANEPDYGQTWSMLASLYADNYGLEIVDLPTPLEKATEFARKGASLDPVNRRARAILAYVRLLGNQLQKARTEAETAYNLCSCSLIYMDVIGWLMSLAGEWERGANYIKKSIQLNPYYCPWVRHALLLNRFREKDYKNAYRESLHFMMPELFWDPLLKASACGHLGKIKEGQAFVRALLALKSDFGQRGCILIGRYVKFEDITDRIIEGLGKLGMNIES